MKEDQKVEFTAGELRAMARDCSQFKTMLEKVKPEVLARTKLPMPERGQVFIHYGYPIIITPATDADGYTYGRVQGIMLHGNAILGGLITHSKAEGNRFNPDKFEQCRPMKDGRIVLEVKHGQICYVIVEKD